MKFSIITICFNAEKNISRTIESVLAQQAKDVEYIIVDGLSSDHTVSLAKTYEQTFKNKGWTYKIISEKDNGIYDAMNKGIRNSSGDVVGILNSGDWYESNALINVEDCFMNSNIGYCYSDIFIVKNSGKRIVKKAKKMKYITSRHWNHPTMFVKREVYNEIGLYKCIGIHDDFDLYLRLRKNNIAFDLIHVPIANFVLGGVSNKKSLKNSILRIRDRYRCYKDNNYNRLYWFECLFMELLKFFIH